MEISEISSDETFTMKFGPLKIFGIFNKAETVNVRIFDGNSFGERKISSLANF